MKSKKRNLQFLLLELWGHIKVNRRMGLILTILLTILASLMEVVSIGATIPFLAVLSRSNQEISLPLFFHDFQLNFLEGGSNSLIVITSLFICAVIFAGCLRMLLLSYSSKISYSIGSDLNNEIFRRTIFQPYQDLISKNSSEVISGIVTKSNSISFNILNPILTLVSSLLYSTLIFITLLFIDPRLALILTVSFLLIYLLIAKLTNKRLYLNSTRSASAGTELVQFLQEALGAVRDMFIDGAHEIYCESFKRIDGHLRMAQSDTQITAQSPRYIIESFGIILMVLISYILVATNHANENYLPVLAAFALGAQRLLPALQQGYASWSAIAANQKTLEDVLELLDVRSIRITKTEFGYKDRLRFIESIELRNVGFRYEVNGPWVFRGINLIIKKGSRVGFIGASGAGKSTLLDILMGLLIPTEGKILVDGSPLLPSSISAWQKHIAHVPQAVFLVDDSIKNNISFCAKGKKLCEARLKQALEVSQLDQVIQSMPNGVNENVGERGINFSGGQQQRIGIARAIYKDADVLILDEATSALDEATERQIINSLESISKGRTILFSTHHISNLKYCSKIYEVKNKGVRDLGNYANSSRELNVAKDLTKNE